MERIHRAVRESRDDGGDGSGHRARGVDRAVRDVRVRDRREQSLVDGVRARRRRRGLRARERRTAQVRGVDVHVHRRRARGG